MLQTNFFMMLPPDFSFRFILAFVFLKAFPPAL